MKNIFLEKSYTKCGGETILRPFSKKIKVEHISGSIVLSFVQFIFIVCEVENYRNILKLNCSPLAVTSYKALLKNKWRSGTSLFVSFST